MSPRERYIKIRQGQTGKGCPTRVSGDSESLGGQEEINPG